MKKHALITLTILSSTALFTAPEPVKTLGTAAASFAGASYVTYKLALKADYKAWDKEIAYDKAKRIRIQQYKLNPTWQQYAKNIAWRMKASSPIVARNMGVVTLLGTSGATALMAVACSIPLLDHVLGFRRL